MDYFKNCIYALCGAGIITSIFRIITSNSKVKKSINIFLSMFIFLYTVIPIEKIISDFKFDFNDKVEIKTYSEIYKEGYETIISNSIEKICSENNVSILSLNIESYVDSDGYLIVEQIELDLSNDDVNDKIAKELKYKFNFEVIFI